MTLSLALTVQRALSDAQKTPVVGPLLVSPYKIVVSLVQIAVAAIFFSIFLISLLVEMLTNAPSEHIWILVNIAECTKHLALGVHAIGYALFNALSLGFNELQIEDEKYFLTLFPPPRQAD